MLPRSLLWVLVGGGADQDVSTSMLSVSVLALLGVRASQAFRYICSASERLDVERVGLHMRQRGLLRQLKCWNVAASDQFSIQ